MRFFFYRSPSRNTANGIIEPPGHLRIYKSGIERMHWDLINGCRYMGIDLQDAMRLKIEVSASIRYDMKFMLVLSDRNPVCRHLEEIDRRCGIERKHVHLHRSGEVRVDLIKPKYDVYRFRPQLLHNRIKSDEIER